VGNRVTGWSYDAEENPLSDQRNTYAYDAEGRIVSLNGSPTYLYDSEGRRVAKYSGSTITAAYLLDLGGNQITELNNSGAWVHSNVFAGGRLLGTYEGTAGPHPNTWHFHLTDWLGTNRMQTTAAGNNEEVCYSYPFGDGLLCTGVAVATEHHFTGKERDAESGLDYFGGRYLNSGLAHWMTPDKDFKLKRILPNPQKWDRYTYVLNNPLVLFDPDGLAEWYVFRPLVQAGTPLTPQWKSAVSAAEARGDHVHMFMGKDATTGKLSEALGTAGAKVEVLTHASPSTPGTTGGIKMADGTSFGSLGSASNDKPEAASPNLQTSVTVPPASNVMERR